MERYYVKRPTGKVFGPFDENAIRLMLKGNKLDSDAQVSTDNESWIPISQVDAFADALGSRTRGGVGVQDLPRRAGPPDLPAPKVPDLPAPRGAVDLPAPKGVSDLPRPAGIPDLPTPKAISDLPRSAGSDLPRPVGGDLPRSAGSDLPQPASNLPRAAGSQLPTSKDTLFESPPDDDLFAAPPGMEEDSDDLFAAPAGLDDSDDLFAAPAGMEEDSDDLFAAPSGIDEDSDDLFAAPAGLSEASDDLFGPPPGDDPLDQGDDDLFEAAPMDDDDLFAAPPDDDDDFLGGDQGFSFLEDDDGADDPFDDGGLEDWEEQIQGNEAFTGDDVAGDEWGDDLIGEPAPETPRPPSRKAPQEPLDHDPFRPASTGIRQPEPSEAATADVEATVDADKKRGLMTLIGVPILAVLLLGGGGFALYNLFSSDEDGPTRQVDRGPTAVTLDLEEIRRDNYEDLRRQIELGHDSDLDTANRGLLLLAQNLFLLRYDDETIDERSSQLAAELAGQEGEPSVAAALAISEARHGQADATRAFAEVISADPDFQFFAHLAMGIADLRAYLKDNDTPDPALPADDDEVDDEEATDEDAGDHETGVADAADIEGTEDTEVAGDEPTPRLVERGLQELTRAAEADPAAPHPHYWTAHFHLAQGAVDDGIHALSRAVDANPDHLPSRLTIGRVYYERGDLNDASEHLSHVVNDLTELGSEVERGLAFHLMGMVHMARQENQEAIEMFTRALNADSSREDTLRFLARTYERAGLYEEALNFFTTNQNLGQEDPEVMLGIARSHMGLEQEGSAIRQLEAGEEMFPEDARFPYYLGRLNLQRGTLYEARRAFETAVELDPDLLDARADLATLYWRLDSDATQAADQIRAIVERPDLIEAPIAAQVAEFYRQTGALELSQEWNEEALRLDPNYWEARLALSRLFLQQNRTSQALRLLERARDEGIQDLRLSGYLAEAYRQNEQFDRAIDEINSVISQRPDDRDFIYTRGRIYFDQGNYATAREDFNYAYQLDPRFHEANFFVGRTSLAEGDYTTAARIFRHVLDYQPDNGRFHYYMGRTFEADGSDGQALDSYRRATAVDPEFAARTPSIFVRRGRLLTRMGFTRQGKRDIAQALEIDPDLTEALLAMGETNYAENDYAEAIRHFSRALEKEPEHPEAQYRLGMAYIYENRNQSGARHLQLALHHGSERADIYRTLGFLYREMGQRNQAVEAFRSYLVEKGDDLAEGDQREILRQIRDLGG